MIEYIAVAVVVIVILVVLILGVKRRRLLNKAHPTRPHSADSTSATLSANTQVYVGNVSYQIGEPEIRDFFAQYGQVETVKLIKDRRTGRSKGFAFVTFEELKTAKKALSAHGKELSGRPLTVRYAKPA